MFSVGTSRRVFFMHSDTESEMKQWIDAIKHNIDTPADRGGGGGGGGEGFKTEKEKPNDNNNNQNKVHNNNFFDPEKDGPRARLAAAKNCIPYLLEVC